MFTAADVPGNPGTGLNDPDQPVFVAEGELTCCVADFLAMVVADTIKKTGFLEESQVIPGTLGYFNLVKLAPVIPLGLRLLLKGKMPPLLMRPVPRVTEIREIFKAAEAKKY